jgi:hypothetical protein
LLSPTVFFCRLSLAFGCAQDDKKSNTGNILITVSPSHVGAVSIDHELYERNENDTKDSKRSYMELKERMTKFLKVIGAHGPNARLQSIEDLIGSLFKTVRWDASMLSPSLLQGMVRGIFLVANWPRLWNPHDGHPGLFEYINFWLGEWQERYRGLDPPGKDAIEALRERVRMIHHVLYPAVLRTAQYDLHAILQELLARGVPTIKGRAAEMPLTPALAILGSRRSPRMRSRRSLLSGQREQLSLPPPLGPFQLVAIDHASVGFGAGPDVGDVAGGSYFVDLQCELVAHSPYKHLIAKYMRKDGSGRFSPRRPVTLSAANRETAGIPGEAVAFVFAYPLASALQEMQDEEGSFRADDDNDGSDSASVTSDGSSALLLADPRLSFLAFGGFVYFSVDGQVLSVNALTNGPGIEFSGAMLLHGGGLRAALHEAERVQPVTIEALCARGVRKFAWLAPGEAIGGIETEHGAFCYFYEERDRHLDCYFEVVQVKELQIYVYSAMEPIEPRRASQAASDFGTAYSSPSSLHTPPAQRKTRPSEDGELAPPPVATPAAAPTTLRAEDTPKVEPDVLKVEPAGEAERPAVTLEVSVVVASVASMIVGLMLGSGLTLAVAVVMGDNKHGAVTQPTGGHSWWW